ncbi:MAG: M14 family metallopeptidase, partial [Flavobacteriaceae bacterium]|nr:M14 family metallopeptidase [Flavobacteriaceae bacterium]
MKIYTLFFLFLSYLTFGQYNTDLDYYLPEGTTYNQDIPTPKSIIGHDVGEWHVTHDKLVQYMQTLAEVSNRIEIENRGTTFEGRPLILLKISSPQNLARLDEIKQKHMQATVSADAAYQDLPIVVYQGFSIHGNEPSGSNAALLVAYHLAAAEGNEINELLNNAIILFDPSFNPDGLQRFAYWANVNKNQNMTSDPQDREYDEVWPGGRTNHYWFDMNRDWLPVQLPESRARIKTFHEWMPNILTDHHEMGSNSTFFFQPGIPSRTHPLTPKLNQTLTAEIGKFHADALNQIGSLYYSEEDYDDFYYGKGSTFPDINGGIGILFEQASSRGHMQETDNGILTFPFTIRNQFTAALSTLKAAKELRPQILKYQHDFYNNARNEGRKLEGKGIVFGDPKDAAKTYHLAEILNRHNIDIHEVKSDFTINGKEYKTGSAYIVPNNQRNTRLINAIFEKRTTFEDSLFYDISAWTFPLAFDLNYSEGVPLSRAGDKITDLKMPEGSVSAMSNYGYLMEWHEYYAPRAAYQLLDTGLRVKASLKTFKMNGKEYDYGTLFIPVQNQSKNAQELFNTIQEVAKTNHVKVYGVSTGLTDGIDLGSREFIPLELPKIALVVGEGISSYDAGEIWHLFDTRMNIPITKLDTKNLNRDDLSKYNTIILPSTYGMSDDIAKNLKTWVQNGGTLIGYRYALNWLKKNEFIKIDFKESERTAIDVTYEDRSNYQGAQVIGGA